MDSGSRRDFIKATAAVGLVGASEASAQPAQSVQLAEAGNAGRASATPKPQIKIGFLHSMTFEFALEEAFLKACGVPVRTKAIQRSSSIRQRRRG